MPIGKRGVNIMDLNNIVNMEILKARMAGMNDLATELIEISSKGNNVPEWTKAREDMIDRCFKVQDEYKKFLIGLNNGEY